MERCRNTFEWGGACLTFGIVDILKLKFDSTSAEFIPSRDVLVIDNLFSYLIPVGQIFFFFTMPLKSCISTPIRAAIMSAKRSF